MYETLWNKHFAHQVKARFNNAIIAHARDSFENDPYAPPRHKVRAWLQAQKADMLNGPTETDAFDPPKRRRRRRESVLAFNNLQQR